MRQAALLLCFSMALTVAVKAGDWPMFGHDPQRTGWATDERTLTPENVSNLELKWKVKVDNQGSLLYALTSPIVALEVSTSSGLKNVVYVAGKEGKIFALDSETGQLLWQWEARKYALPTDIGLQGSVYCPYGVIATPTFDRRTEILFTIAEGGALYGLDLGSGKVRFGPVQFVPPFSKNWSLNLVGDSIYTTLSQGCGGALSGFYSIDIRNRHHPIVRQLLLSNTDTAGIWGRGGAVIGKNGRVYGSTADGFFNPKVGDYSDSVVAASQDELDLVDHFTPSNWRELDRRDLDYGSASPVWFGWKNYNLLASGAKEGVLYLLDADSLGGKDHQTPLTAGIKLGNDPEDYSSHGIWGGLSIWRDADGETWLYVPVYGPVSKSAPQFSIVNGAIADGSVMAFKVAADGRTDKPVLEPAWISGNFKVPDPVAIANGVVFVLETGENPEQRGEQNTKTAGQRLTKAKHAVLHALDARTGKDLYNSGQAIDSWVHFSGLAIAEGRIYVVDYGSNVYCFGVSTQSSEKVNIDAPAVYKENCAMCHRADGRGYPAMKTPDFTLKEWQAQHPDEELIEAVTKGRGTMPPFEKKLKPEEIKRVIEEVIRNFVQ
jgi:outer membrane protein assembly factor BamB